MLARNLHPAVEANSHRGSSGGARVGRQVYSPSTDSVLSFSGQVGRPARGSIAAIGRTATDRAMRTEATMTSPAASSTNAASSVAVTICTDCSPMRSTFDSNPSRPTRVRLDFTPEGQMLRQRSPVRSLRMKLQTVDPPSVAPSRAPRVDHSQTLSIDNTRATKLLQLGRPCDDADPSAALLQQPQPLLCYHPAVSQV